MRPRSEDQCEWVRAFVMHVDQTDAKCRSITSYMFKYVFLHPMPSQGVNISRNIHGRVTQHRAAAYIAALRPRAISVCRRRSLRCHKYIFTPDLVNRTIYRISYPHSPKRLMTTTERTFVSVDDTQIYAESAGDSTKPTIVFIHGLASSGTCWDNQFSDPALLRDFHLVRYDLRGHGRSGKPLDPKSYESIRFAEDFKAVCDGFGCSKPFLAGWSLGGTSALLALDSLTC